MTGTVRYRTTEYRFGDDVLAEAALGHSLQLLNSDRTASRRAATMRRVLLLCTVVCVAAVAAASSAWSFWLDRAAEGMSPLTATVVTALVAASAFISAAVSVWAVKSHRNAVRRCDEHVAALVRNGILVAA